MSIPLISPRLKVKPDIEAFVREVVVTRRHGSSPETQDLTPDTPARPRGMSRLFGDMMDSSELAMAPDRRWSWPHEGVGCYFENNFENLGLVGQGDFGWVFRVRSRQDGQIYAVKKSKRNFRGTNDRDRALQEVQSYSLLRQGGSCPQCVTYFRAWTETGKLYIQTEYLKNGTLQQYLNDNACLEEHVIWSFLADLALGLEFIHSVLILFTFLFTNIIDHMFLISVI
jgi:membrane-associated tyrosine/threonine-specific cdc2-inhibitory kinase